MLSIKCKQILKQTNDNLIFCSKNFGGRIKSIILTYGHFTVVSWNNIKWKKNACVNKFGKNPGKFIRVKS